ncbi:MAG: ATP-binding protein [Salinirussus sp.]
MAGTESVASILDRQPGASWIVSGVGLSLAALSTWYLIAYPVLPAAGADWLVATLAGLEALLLAACSVGLVYAGHWLATKGFDRHSLWWAGLWTLIGLAGVVGLVVLVRRTHMLAGGSVDVATFLGEVLVSAGAGAIAGLLIGVASLRASRSRATVEDQRASLEFMNALLRHNVLNGMQVIDGHATLLRDRLEDPEALEALDAIEAQSETITDLVQDARTLSEAISGEPTLNSLDVAPVVHEAVETVRQTHDANIDCSVASTLPVRADDLVGAVFDNVLENAVEHGGDEPTVRVTADREADSVRIMVADDGPGVPAELRDTVFEPGEQGPGSVGRGLGLYLVRTLVNRYGGEVWIDDAPDLGGARVTIELPAAPE